MTREEAIKALRYRRNIINNVDIDWCANEIAAIDVVLSALRTPTREMVEKVWRGEWIDCSNGWMCSRCENDNTYAKPFCPSCGAAMTEEAVEMVMERWKEAVSNEA